MTFKEKIDKILEFNELGVNSVSALEDIIEASRGSVNEFYNSNREPGRKTLKRIMSLPGLNAEWYKEGKGPIFLKNGTYVEIPMENKKNGQPSMDDVLRHLVEGDTNYILINKELILEKYRLVSIEKMEEEKKESQRKHDEILKDLEDRKNQIHGLYKIISEITSKLPDPGKTLEVDKA